MYNVYIVQCKYYSQLLASNLGVSRHNVMFFFAAPETRAVDCEGSASGGASSPWWNPRDLRSQLRLVGEAIWYVDGIQLVTDFDRTAHLRLSVWEQTNQTDRCRQTATWRKELKCVFKEVISSQSYLIIPNRLLFCRHFFMQLNIPWR